MKSIGPLLTDLGLGCAALQWTCTLHGSPLAQCGSVVCRCPVAALAFLDQDSAAAGKLAQAGTSSPLLILTEDRQYHLAYPGAAADAVSTDARAELTLAQGVMLLVPLWQSAYRRKFPALGIVLCCADAVSQMLCAGRFDGRACAIWPHNL